jgi:hypothetical protein
MTYEDREPVGVVDHDAGAVKLLQDLDCDVSR